MKPHQFLKTMTEDKRNSIVSEYTNGNGLIALGDKYGVASSTIHRFLTKYCGVSLRAAGWASVCIKNRKYSLNQSAFDDAENNPDAQYWLGMLMGDGHITFHKSVSWYLHLGLSGNDGCHLNKFALFLGSNQPINVMKKGGGFANSSTAYRISVCSRRLCEAVAKYGVTQRKTHTAEVKILENSNHFWRGCIDADGWTMLRTFRGRLYPHIGLTGSRKLIEQFASYVGRVLSRPTLTIHPNGCVWKIQANGRDAAALAKIIYVPGAVALPRKSEKAAAIGEWKPLREWRASY